MKSESFDLNHHKHTKITKLKNYYGSLVVAKINDKFYASIQNHNGAMAEPKPKSLYTELLKFENHE